MNKKVISWLLCVSLIMILAGCACSKKTPENSAPTAGQEQAEANSGQTKGGDSMGWKYQNEVLIKSDEPDALDRIDDLYDQAGDDRSQVHYQFEVKSFDDFQKLSTLLFDYGYKVTTFEILIPAGVVPDEETRIPLMIDKRADTRLIVSGKGDKPVEMPPVLFDLMAGTIVVKNFVFKRQEYRTGIGASVIDDFIAENLNFSDSVYERRNQYMAGPLMLLMSHAPEGKSSNYKLKDVTFMNNQSNGLLQIEDNSLGKFKHIELDHVVAKGNVNLMMGIDVSASEDALVKNCELTGSTAAPTIYQILPQTQVKFVDSSVADNAYGYRPKTEDWHTDPKPVIQENLKEADGTV